jgi:hypothetical protein
VVLTEFKLLTAGVYVRPRGASVVWSVERAFFCDGLETFGEDCVGSDDSLKSLPSEANGLVESQVSLDTDEQHSSTCASGAKETVSSSSEAVDMFKAE